MTFDNLEDMPNTTTTATPTTTSNAQSHSSLLRRGNATYAQTHSFQDRVPANLSLPATTDRVPAIVALASQPTASTWDSYYIFGQARHRHRLLYTCIFGSLSCAVGSWITCMMRESDNTRGPAWDPAGTVPFRQWVREVHAWLNVQSDIATPSRHAAALQHGLQGQACSSGMRAPSNVINFGAQIEGVHADPVTFLLFNLSQRFGALEKERHLQQGLELLDVRAGPNGRIEGVLARWEVARRDAAAAGFDLQNFQLLSAQLMRALRMPPHEVVSLLQRHGRQMQRARGQCDHLAETTRRRRRIYEGTPGDAIQALNGQIRWDIHAVTETEEQRALLTGDGQ